MKIILDDIRLSSNVLAAWEGGSAATGTRDQYSDIDLCILTNSSLRPILDQVETSLGKLQVSHTWQPLKCFWGEGMMQRVIVLKDSPKHFSVDVAVFDQAHPQLLKDFLEVERHGQPLIYFDKSGLVMPVHTDAIALFKKQQARAEELSQGFPIFKTLVLKEMDRGQAIDAISFYQNGLVRPFIEVAGMIYRPFKSDFGMRYIHKTFPKGVQELIEDLSYVSNVSELPNKILKVEKAFNEAVMRVKNRTAL
ncbi:MAG: nucleotidyltransferase domain-containing protein [Pseudobdellovibrionaceae bacterium]